MVGLGAHHENCASSATSFSAYRDKLRVFPSSGQPHAQTESPRSTPARLRRHRDRHDHDRRTSHGVLRVCPRDARLHGGVAPSPEINPRRSRRRRARRAPPSGALARPPRLRGRRLRGDRAFVARGRRRGGDQHDQSHRLGGEPRRARRDRHRLAFPRPHDRPAHLARAARRLRRRLQRRRRLRAVRGRQRHGRAGRGGRARRRRRARPGARADARARRRRRRRRRRGFGRVRRAAGRGVLDVRPRCC